MLKDIRSMSYDELSEEILKLGFPKFRIKQIFSWVHEKCVTSFDEMTNISKDMRVQLSECFYFNNCQINTKLVNGRIKNVSIKTIGKMAKLNAIYSAPFTLFNGLFTNGAVISPAY